MDYEGVELTSSTIPTEYRNRIVSAVSDVVRELRSLGYGWDALCNFAYMAANDGVYNVETDEIYAAMKH